MAYTPINWQTGDTITAEKMNKMDNGWGVESTQLFSETVTTVASEYGNMAALAYTGTNAPDSMNITYDGTAYACTRINMGGDAYGYGDMNLTDYPFILGFDGSSWMLMTQTAGSHTIAGAQTNVETSTEFESAVNSIVNTSTMPLLCVSGVTTSNEIRLAVSQRRLAYFVSQDDDHYIIKNFVFSTETDATVNFFPEFSLISASVTNGVFTVTESWRPNP